ncbi:hypothetical protein SMICM17S_06519 [Streptomyces microflavus]
MPPRRTLFFGCPVANSTVAVEPRAYEEAGAVRTAPKDLPSGGLSYTTPVWNVNCRADSSGGAVPRPIAVPWRREAATRAYSCW